MNARSIPARDLAICLRDHVQNLWSEAKRPVLVGLCGAQGAGKSTLAHTVVQHLKARGMRSQVVSLDDFYLSREERLELAAAIHPLLLTRGVPGTHDIKLLSRCLDQLTRHGHCELPRFDKARDTRLSGTEVVATPVDIVVFEGWCVGARPQTRDELAIPVNQLEAEEDPTGVWRSYVQDQLAGPYQELFLRLDALALLMAPSFEVVFKWRRQQEQTLQQKTGKGMNDVQLSHFIAHYERLTRWILREMPARADWCFALDEDRRWLAD